MAYRSGLIVASCVFLFLSGCGGEPAGTDNAAAMEEEKAPLSIPAPDQELIAIAAGEHRAADNVARNSWRHPVETLQFFGLEKGMVVAEIWPAGGWYTEVIAPYLQGNGTYVAAHWDPESSVEFIRKGVARYQEKLDAHPDLYSDVEMTVLMHPDNMDFMPDNSVDMIVTFRNVHNWMGRDYADEMLSTLYKVLKPGGILGVVEHRGDPAVPQDPKAASGYVNQDYMVELAEKAGFQLVGGSEINANPLDTKDYEAGVWSLPPTLRAGDEQRYRDIGESDRFTLKFVK
ncbi:MAG: methyltransferase domain-containing protein [Gammaproteobacteria bacterium]|nr:methyltransferase domain-containing protein [Gammaproteobacteria bacterium]